LARGQNLPLPYRYDLIMIQINLKKIISKKDLSPIIHSTMNALDTPLEIQDNTGEILCCFGKYADSNDLTFQNKYPIELNSKIIGWVKGNTKANFASEFLAFLVRKEHEKRSLVNDVLDKYREITLLYNITDKMAECLELKDIASLIIDEARRLITATSASIMLLKDGVLEIISAYGPESTPKTTLRQGEGIAGDVVTTGTAEIINDVLSDARFTNGHNKISSLICAPLKIKDRIIGVFNMSSKIPHNYNSNDLKFMCILASQAASAMENAILYENKMKTEHMKAHLQRYVSPQIVSTIMEDTEGISLNPSKRNISILFSDIRNFSATCEKLAPEEIVKYLNEYFTQMVKIIFEHHGTINKFVGDMIVAFFGAPSCSNEKNEIKAIKSAIEMQQRLRRIDMSWIKDNFHTGIGITTGDVVVGNIGSPQHMDYTAIGDVVNIADRLQSLAEGGEILVEQNVYESTKNVFKYKKFGNIAVKGKKTPIEIFSVLY